MDETGGDKTEWEVMRLPHLIRNHNLFSFFSYTTLTILSTTRLLLKSSSDRTKLIQ